MKFTKSQEDALDLDRSLCVTAGAGAGKTGVLVERYLRLLERGVKVSQILALTFTEKAAAEMKEKVRKALSEKEGEVWKERLEEFNWASISTFHSFCSNLIRQYPLVSGVAPRFQVLDDVNLSLMGSEIFDSLLNGECGAEVHDSLVRSLTWYGSWTMKDRLEYMYERRAEMAGWLEAHRKKDALKIWAEEMDARALHERVHGMLSDPGFHASLLTLSALATTHSGQGDGGQKYLANVGPIVDTLLAGGDDFELLDSLRELDSVEGRKGMGSVGKIFTKEAKADLNDAFEVVREALKQACLTEFSCGGDRSKERTVESTYDLIRVYDSYAAAMQAAKRKDNSIDFGDMIATAQKLVQRDDVVTSLRNRYRNLLVDEFQDTDPIQSMIVWAVAGDDPVDRLFIVGDPKQSIYGFRSADVAMFLDAKRRLVDRDSEAGVHLDVNFRSTRQVVDVVNHVFSRLMVEEDRDYKFPYEGMCLSPEKADDVGSVELMLPAKPAKPVAGQPPVERMSEPELVAARVQAIVDVGDKSIYIDKEGKHLDGGRRPEYGDVTILLRARTHLKMFEKALRDRDIPYVVHKGLGFFERQEIMDVYNILSFLADSSDDVSTYGMLRSPYFAFSDEELYFISRGEGFDLWGRLKNMAGKSDPRSVQAVGTLESWLSRAGRMPIAELLHYVQLTSGISAVYAAQVNSDQLQANLDKLTSKLRDASADGICMPHQAVEWMENAMVLARLEGEAPMEISSVNAVNIMTVHASKGLEFPIVIVPELGSPPRGQNGSILFDEGIGLGLTVLGEDYTMQKNAAMMLIGNEEKEKDAEELKRLLYVAMTRARDHLVLSGKRGSDERETTNWMDHLLYAIAPQDIPDGVNEIVINDAVKVAVIREEDIGADEAVRPEPAPFTLPEGMDGMARWTETPRPQRSLALTVTGLESFESYPEGFIRRNVFGIPEGWLKKDTRSDAMLFGTAAHEVLQGRDPGSVARKYGLPASSVTDLAKIKERFFASKGRNGDIAYRELKFTTDVDGQRFQGKVDRFETTSSGMVNVIDFKTDAVKPGNEEKDAQNHADQLRAYSLMMTKAMHSKVQGQVYFTGSGKYVNISEEAGFEAGLKRKIKDCSERVKSGSGNDDNDQLSKSSTSSVSEFQV